MRPSLREEKRLWKKGFKRVICLDEAGRGPLAGPVVAAAVTIYNFNSKILKELKGVKDSKKLSPKKRKEIFKKIKKIPQIKWATSTVSPRIIDKINILEATKLAMERATKKLFQKIKGKRKSFLIVDGNFEINLKIPQKSIVKGDEKVFSCALSSIIAKVKRDKIMEKYSKKYPKYKFEIHKGYPTKLHLKLLKKYGPSKIHRRTFKGVK